MNLSGKVLFDRYQIERELGRGGMGVVVLAFDTKLQLNVALKLIPDQLVSDKESINDLRREVHRGMALMHSGIVRTHTFELDPTGAAVVMEFIDGHTLSDLREDQPGRCFDPDELLPWLASLCEVIDYAHREARIVHRDLKPRNIMLSRDGRIKVADFGIAAVLTDTFTRNTGKDMLGGTPPYMSPQQAQGKRPEPSDDIYSLGATLYDLLTGKPPFFRGPHQAIIMQVCTVVPPSIAERRIELGVQGKNPVPHAWEETIAACLAKEPAGRPPSAAAVLARLRSAPLAPPAAPARSTRRLLVLALATILVCAAAGWLLYRWMPMEEAPIGYIPSVGDKLAVSTARTLLASRQPEEAEAYLARLPEGYPPGDVLKVRVSRLLEEGAQRAAREWDDAINALLAKSEAALKAGNLEDALKPLDEITTAYDPTHAGALAAKMRIDARKAEDRDAVAFRTIFADSQAALDAGDHDHALSLLGTLPATYSTVPVVTDLRRRIEVARIAAEQARLGEQQRQEAAKAKPLPKKTTLSRQPPPPTRKPVKSATSPTRTTPPLRLPGTPRPGIKRAPNFLY